MKTSTTERVAEFFRWTMLSTNALAKRLNLPQRSVYNYVKGKAAPTESFIVCICKAFPEVNEEYLRTGKGVLLVDHESSPPSPDSSKISLYEQLVESLKGQVSLLTGKCADLEEQVKTLRKMIEDNDNNKA